MSHAMLSSPILAALNSGVIVVDDEYNIQYLNAFIERHGNLQLAENFLRAAELALLPDERVMAIYEALRPRRSTAGA